MDKNTLFFLIDKYFNGSATPQEKALLEEYYDRLEKIGTSNLSEKEKAMLKKEMYRNILRSISDGGKIIPLYKRSIFRVAAAAAILIFLVVGSYFIFLSKSSQNHNPEIANLKASDILPGRNTAILTLSDGKKIILDTTKGTIGKQGNTTVINLSGLLTYQQQEANSQELVYNTVTTARGNQYQLVLADGSKVWLNAASSITFPTSFIGKERRVTITGEAYFEVAHDANKPFHVNVRRMDVQVLGTHFNINSYSDEESINTTLFEGSIKISMAGKTKLVKPGEQTQTTKNNEITLVNDVDLDAVLAWKNGFFSFKNADLQTILRQASRWYDVDVSFEKNAPMVKFSGEIGKTLTLTQFLNILNETRIHYKIEGRKLIITP